MTVLPLGSVCLPRTYLGSLLFVFPSFAGLTPFQHFISLSCLCSHLAVGSVSILLLRKVQRLEMNGREKCGVKTQTEPSHLFSSASLSLCHWRGNSSCFRVGSGLDWDACRCSPAEEPLHCPSPISFEAGGESASLWLPKFPYPIPLIWQIFATCQKQEIGFDLDYDL